MKVSQLKKKAAEAKAITPEAIKERLRLTVIDRVNRAGALLGEALDHLNGGSVTAAEIGALAEVNAAVSEAVSAAAFYLQVDQKGSEVPGIILPPEPEIVLPG